MQIGDRKNLFRLSRISGLGLDDWQFMDAEGNRFRLGAGFWIELPYDEQLHKWAQKHPDFDDETHPD